METTLELGNRRDWNSLKGSEEDSKMWESLELPRKMLNGFDQNADSDVDNEVQDEVISYGGEELTGNWHKVTLAMLYQRDRQPFVPSLEICGTLNTRKII